MKNIIARLQVLVSEVPEMLARFSPSEMTEQPAPDKWSKREILGHLVDSATHNLHQFLYVQIEDGFELKLYPRDELVRAGNYQNQPSRQIADAFVAMNLQLITVLKSMPEKVLSKVCKIPWRDNRPETIRWVAGDYLRHMEHHLRQIFPGEKIPAPVLPHNYHISIEAAEKALAGFPDSDILFTLMEYKKTYAEIYAPIKIDHQLSHEQDEFYVIISGTGTFFCDGKRRPFQPGDLIFVPIGVEHRFEDFSDDFKTWVIFY